VSSTDDPFNNAAVDIGTLVTGDKRVCLKNLHVVDPGPAPLGMTLVGIDLRNIHKQPVLVDIVVRPSQFSAGFVGLLLPHIALGHQDGVSDWLGRHTITKAGDRLHSSYRVDEVVVAAPEETD